MMERRVDSPPTIPRFPGIPGARVATKHVTPHDGGADVRQRILDNPRAFVDLSALKPLHRAPDGEWKHPLVQADTANPEGVVDALAGTGNEAVERHRDLEAQPGQVTPRSETAVAARLCVSDSVSSSPAGRSRGRSGRRSPPTSARRGQPAPPPPSRRAARGPPARRAAS